MVNALQFTEQDWEQIRRDWSAWWAGELERPLVMLSNPVRSRDPLELTEAFLRDWPIEQILDYYQTRLANTELFGDAWPKWWPFYGAGVLAAFLDAKLLCAPEEGTIWFEPTRVRPVRELELAFTEQNPWWQRILQLTQAALDRWQDQVCIGYTDLGGNLDVLASLRGSQNLLLDLYDDPAAVESACQAITAHWLAAYERLGTIITQTGRGYSPWAPIWASGPAYMLQSDFCAMISPKMFERFVLPDLEACCQAIEYPFYHLDGKGQLPHLDLLLGIEKLRGIQWIPGDGQPPPQEWLPVLKRIRDGGKLCQLFVDAQGALKIARELGGQGFAFAIHESLSPAEAHGLLDTLYALG